MIKETLRVSVIIPSYNQKEYIARTLRSVLEQDYQNFEIILVDGGSTDGTLAVVNEFRDRIAIIVSEKDDGQASAINKGFNLATGDIIGWINSDDTFTREAFTLIIKAFESDDSVDFVYGDIRIIDDHDNVLGFLKGRTLNFPAFTWKLDLHVPQQGAFWRRSALQRGGLKLNESFHYVLDRDIFLRSLVELNARYIDSLLGNFRRQGESKSVASSNKWLDEMPVLYNFFIRDYGSNVLSSTTISKIKAMIDLYVAIEHVKKREFFRALGFLFCSLLRRPDIILISGLPGKVFGRFTKVI